MVSFKPVAAAVLAVAPTAMGYITGFTTLDNTATAGGNVTGKLQTAVYSQTWTDIGIIWGLSSPEYPCNSCVGTEIAYTALTGNEGLKSPYTFIEALTIPSGTSAGDYILNAAIPYVVGDSGVTGFSYYTSNLTIS